MADPVTLDRRTLLGALAGASTTALAGCSLLDDGADASTTQVEGERARVLAERFAPTLYFDVAERWYPTDPRAYATERDGDTVVDGFTAVNEYTRTRRETGRPPNPTVFYHVVEYTASPLAAVQFWLYSPFDQFTTNFHWHDWEVLHVFVDTETGDPQLYVASAHARRVPNNEFIDPAADTPHVLAELGSHSSALSVNEDRNSFNRLPGDGLLADVTNSTIEGIDVLSEIPLAYGLPRGEGFRLPFVVPELDGVPLYDHPGLPAVSRDDLLPPAHTVRSFDALLTPPADLPARETEYVFTPAAHDESPAGDAVAYDLLLTNAVEHVTAFTGPQLSFEFAVPKFAENAVASHLTTTNAPWTQPRYANPAADITDPSHRHTMAARYDAIGEPSAATTLVAAVSDVTTDPDAPDGAGVTTDQPAVEAVALLESDPTAAPTFRGVAAVRDVPAGDHRLTVNRAGTAPHAETVPVPDAADASGPVAAGVDGEVPLVANEDATKLEVDATGTDAPLTEVAVADDFAGRLYDSPIDGPDAVYVHRGGAYTTEVRDADGAVGAHRVNPGPDADRVRVASPDTGKAALARYVAAVATETKADIAALEDTDDASGDGAGSGSGDGGGDGSSGGGDGNNGGAGQSNAVRGLVNALDAVADAAARAAERAAAGDRGNANQALDAVASRLDTVTSRLGDATGAIPATWHRATRHRVAQSKTRTTQARDSAKL